MVLSRVVVNPGAELALHIQGRLLQHLLERDVLDVVKDADIEVGGAEALEAGAKMVLLDNMSLPMLREDLLAAPSGGA